MERKPFLTFLGETDAGEETHCNDAFFLFLRRHITGEEACLLLMKPGTNHNVAGQ
jgi:hypothetical protein